MSDTQDMDEFAAALRYEFLSEAIFLLSTCEEAFLKLDQPDRRSEELAHIFRAVHTIKGSGAAVGFDDLASFAHGLEDCLSLLRAQPTALTTGITSLLLRAGDALRTRIESQQANQAGAWDTAAISDELRATSNRLRGTASAPVVRDETPTQAQGFELFSPVASAPDGDDAGTPASAPGGAAEPPTTDAGPTRKPPGQASVKVDLQRIDAVLDLVGELVVIKSQLVNQAAPYSADLKLAALVGQLDKAVREVQDRALGMRLTPLKPLFLKLQRLVRDVSLKLDKPVDLQISGEDIEIDRTTVERLADPLMHIMRNAIDHGIEARAQRLCVGKTERACIQLRAHQIGSRVVVTVSDDGAGLARDKILKTAVQRQLVHTEQTAAMTDSEVYNLIFAPGFSTAEMVTDLSGRGVGLDVVRTNMDALKGTVEVSSTPGAGSCFQLSTPLTASITDGIVEQVGDALYVVPVDGVRELLKSGEADLTQLRPHQRMLRVRGSLVPLFDLGGARQTRGEMVILVDSGAQSLALEVDVVVGQSQVVRKPVPEGFGHLPGISGVAVMGDGRIALVVDIDGLLRHQLGAAGALGGKTAPLGHAA